MRRTVEIRRDYTVVTITARFTTQRTLRAIVLARILCERMSLLTGPGSEPYCTEVKSSYASS